jgi:hypothetical protein
MRANETVTTVRKNDRPNDKLAIQIDDILEIHVSNMLGDL